MSTTESLLERLQKRAQEAPTSPQAAPVTHGQINPPEAALSLATPEPTPPDLPPPANDATAPEPGTKDITEALEAEKRPTRRVPKQKATPPKEQKQIGTLYVNCIPIAISDFVPVVPFESVLEAARKTVSNTKFRDKVGEPEYAVPDYRFVHYGQGPAVLLAAIAQVLEEQGRIEELVMSDSTTPEAQICLSHLLARCDRVVRSTR